ncbi:hypothetical protein [Pseudomonas sp. Irchel 3A5]|jgi:hypothetical protein|uniref:hypothetical protein n=1 Tax=Pseudomonas sp. Irchel 3A5 TaxID=2008911 RepID=UPI000BA4DAC3|nr:hypothetical protein [Pseudomonas sp. Irchel 3A5]
MELHLTLVLEIEKFESWEQPWRFYEVLSASTSLDADAREMLHIVWIAAIEYPSWRMSNELEASCLLADARLKSDFPWLSEQARRQLVNAVAYLWR